jgi:hypothetical protein
MSIAAPRQKRMATMGRLANSTSFEEAKKLSTEFHGRDVEDIVEVLESYSEPVNLADLGILEELVVNPIHSKYEYPINFEEQNKEDIRKVIKVASNSKGEQLYFVGGDQNIDEIVNEIHSDTDSYLNLDHRQYLVLGHCISIAYFTDKHHLAGPKYQAEGTSYEHEFGEDGGYPPILLYDKLNKRLMLMGGTYHVAERGIID